MGVALTPQQILVRALLRWLEGNMKRIIRQDGPKATDRELALQKLRDSQGDFSALTDEKNSGDSRN